MHANRRNYGCRINDELEYKGLKLITMENEKIKLSILVGKGTDILELVYKPKDIDFMWISPKNFSSSDIKGNFLDNSDFLETFLGGWQEIIPNGGSPCIYKGASYRLHDETPKLPWNYQILEDTSSEISLKFFLSLKKMPLYVEKIITLKEGKSEIYIDEKIINKCGETLNFMWGHHPCLGEPFLSSDCIISFNAKELISNPASISSNPLVKQNSKGTLIEFPGIDGSKVDLSKVLSKKACVADLLYAKDLYENWFAVTNLKQNLGIGFLFDSSVFKYLYLWLVYGGGNDYPWYSSTYNLAVEPWSSYPGLGLIESIKNGTALEIKPEEELSSWVKVVVFEKSKPVSRIDEDLNVY